MPIKKIVVYANFGDRRSRYRDLGTLKRQFLGGKYSNSFVTKKRLNVECWNLKSTWVQIDALRSLSLEVAGYVTTILEDESRQKMADLKRYILVGTDFDKKKAGGFLTHH